MQPNTLLRINYYFVAANLFIAGWIIAGVLIAILRTRQVDFSWWVSVHSFTIGVIATAILVYSQHFTEALTRNPSISNKAKTIRLVLLQLGLIGLIAGGAGNQWGVGADIAATTIIGVFIWQAFALIKKLRGSLAGSFVVTVPFYLVAASNLIIGVALAIMASHEIGDYTKLIIGHSRLLIWGFATLTVLGTVVTLLPTIAGGKISRVARSRMARGLVVYCLGLYEAIIAISFFDPKFAAIGIMAMWLAFALIFSPVLQAILSAPINPASCGIIAGCLWLLGLLALDIFSFITHHDGRYFILIIVLPLIFGGFIQLITSVVSYLLPALFRLHIDARKAMMRSGFARLVLINLGSIFALLGHEYLGLMLAIPSTLWTITVLIFSLTKYLKGLPT